jgi:hypothetical protein
MIRLGTLLAGWASVAALLALAATPAAAQLEAGRLATADGSVLDATGVTEVRGGDSFLVTFSATHDGQPLPGVSVNVERHRYTDYEYALILESTTSHVTDERGQVVIEVVAGAVDYYEFQAAAELPDGWWNVEHTVNVERADSVLTPGVLPVVTPGDAVEILVTLTTDDGAPLAGQDVEFEIRYRNASPRTLLSAVTDEQGQASVVEGSEAQGYYGIRYSYEGTVQHDDAVVFRTLYRDPAPTTLTVTGPESGEGGVPITLEGTLLPSEGPVTIQLEHYATGDVTTTMTDESGDWQAEVVPLPGPNWWTVTFPGTTRQATSSATYSLETPRLVTAFENITQNAAAGDSYRLSGRLVPDVGMTSFTVTWDDGPPRTFTTASGDGSFVVFDKSPATSGLHTLRLSYAGDHRALPATEELVVDVAKGDPGFSVYAGQDGVAPGKAFYAEGRIDYRTEQTTYVDVVGPDGEHVRVPVYLQNWPEFSIGLVAPDTPGQTAEWTVTFPGDEHHVAATDTFTAYVKEPHLVTIGQRPNPITIGEQLKLRVRAPETVDAQMRIAARDPSGTLVWEWSGVLPWWDTYLYEAPLKTALRVTASIQADSRHTATTKSYVVRPRRAVTTRLGGPHEQVGHYAVYDRSRRPRFVSRALPAPSCVTQRVQVLTGSGWREFSRACRAVTSDGTALSTFDGDRTARVRYRVRSVVRGNEWYRPSTSAWRYFRFQA